jgi:hypothetical protein
MRPRLFLYAVPAALLWTGFTLAQQPASPADLFPARVLAYAELRQPGPLAQEIASLFHGSLLANVPDSLAKLQAKLGKDDFHGEHHRVGAVGLALSPEVIKEVGRIKGAAAAFLGIENGEPQYLAVVLPGESLVPTFVLRAYLTVDDARPVGKVEGVMVYRAGSYRQARPEGVGRRESGPAFAMTPEALFIGSTEAVKDAVRRLKGQGGGSSLAKSERFQEAGREAPNEPGLFAYADPAGLFEVLRKVAVPDLADVARAINPKGFRSVFDSLTLSNGTLPYRRTVLLDPNEKSPLLEILPNAPADLSLLRYVPKDAVLAAALSNGEGAKRWPKLLEFMDTIARVSGARGPLPSEAIRQMEQGLGVDFAKDVAGKIKTIGFALGNLQSAPVRKVVRKGPGFESGSIGPEVPAVFLIEATDEDAARKLTEELLPRFLRMVSRRQTLGPTRKQVKGQTILSLKMAEHEHVHYGRHGKTIVLGPYEDPVALALASGAVKDGWLTDPKLAGRLQEQSIFLAVAKPVSGLMGAFFMTGSAYYGSTPAPQVEKGVAPPPAKQDGPGDQRVKVTVERGPAQLGPEQQKMMKELSKLLAKEQPLVFSVTRSLAASGLRARPAACGNLSRC